MKQSATVYSFLLLVPLFLLSCSRFRPDPVTAPELEEHVRILAADAMEGRMTGTGGIAAAEEYIAGAFTEYRLQPLQGSGDGAAFYQQFALQPPVWETDTPLLLMSRGGEEEVFSFDLENYPLPGAAPTGDKGVAGEIVFAGYGIDAPEYGYNDYEHIDVEGKIVLVFRYEPNENDPDSVFDGKRHSKYATFLYKMQTAQRKGAVGLVLLDNPLHHSGPDPYAPPAGFPGTKRYPPKESGGLPGLHVSADRIAAFYPSVDFPAIQRSIDRGKAVPELPYAEGQIILRNAGEESAITGRNVAGYISSKGRRRGGIEAEKRLIVVGAHHDHLGMLAEGAEGDRIFNGADDNASGVAAVLELAEHFSRRRTGAGLVFVTFSAEELGLFGSKAILEEIPALREKTVAMINFDMIGRNPEQQVTVHYSGTDSFRSLLKAQLPAEYELNRRRGGMRGYISDSYMFSEYNIPAAFFFTGLHDDYHMPSDEAEMLDYGRMEEITQEAADLIEALAGEGPPQGFRAAPQREKVRRIP